MLSFPNAKINLGLNITSKRDDGYHNLESCFYPIPWCDVLEIIPAPELKFTTSGLEIPGSAATNLCLKAYELIKEAFEIPAVHIHLHKVIPMGAGLGGGSADGAFALKMLNEMFVLELGTDAMQGMAAKLGSDCPFFIENKPMYVMGTGGIFHPVDLTLSGKYIVLRHPGIHIGTGEAYSRITPQPSGQQIPELLLQPISEWQHALKNDFEESVFPHHPEVARLKGELYEKGALYAAMSGSGSAVFGIFDHQPDLPGHEVFLFA